MPMVFMPLIAYCSRQTMSRSVLMGPPLDFTVATAHPRGVSTRSRWGGGGGGA
jgi:hypothetical protein